MIKTYSCVMDAIPSLQLVRWINRTFLSPPLDPSDNSAEWCRRPTGTMHLQLVNLLWAAKKHPCRRTTYFTAHCAVPFNRMETIFQLHLFTFGHRTFWKKIITLWISVSLHHHGECFACWIALPIKGSHWWSAVTPPPQFKCQKVCILANCLVKGQPAFDNETHGGRSLEVLRAAGAY